MSSRVVIKIYLGLLELSMLFKHKQSRFVYNSGSMSATVANIVRNSGSCTMVIKCRSEQHKK